MNSESEQPIPSPENNTRESDEITRSIPEGFYNPETERIPVPRTEAARSLTKLVDIIAPGMVDTTGVDNRHQIDAVSTEFQETLVPTTGTHKAEFMNAISPFLTQLENVGLGDYRSAPYLKNIENFTVTAEDRIVFNGLYTPWQYGPKGNVIPAVDIEKMRQAISKLPDNTETEKQTKQQAEMYLSVVEAALQEEMLKSPETLAEGLDEPNLEHLETLRDTLGLISDEMIAQVAALNTAEAAKNSANRALMKSLTAPLMTLMKSLRKNTKIGADTTHEMYPEFWQLVDKYHQINCAMGITYNNRNEVNHEVSYPTL